MSRYTIPQQARRGLDAIAALTPEQVREIIEALKSVRIGDSPKELAESISSTTLNKELLKEILVSLFSMVNIFYESNNSIEQFTDDFVESYSAKFDEMDAARDQNFRRNLALLIPSFSFIKHSIKAKSLLIANFKNFSSAHIISDIRMVFDDENELSKSEQYAVIVHHLKITDFNEFNSGNETHFALDLSDLIKLKDVVNRAIEKDNLIRSQNYKLSFIEPK